jgi:hypothetical protein
VAPLGFSLCNNVLVRQGRVETYGTNMEPAMVSGAKHLGV